MPYVNPRPKKELVRVGTRLEPSTLALVDRALGVIGMSREAWLRTLVQLGLVTLAKRADSHLERCKGRVGRNAPLPPVGAADNVPAWKTKSRTVPKRPKIRR